MTDVIEPEVIEPLSVVDAVKLDKRIRNMVGRIDDNFKELAALVEADAYACVRGVGLVFAAVPDSITRLLMITGMSLRGSAPS